MRLSLGARGVNENELENARLRALRIVRYLRQRPDERVRNLIEGYAPALAYEPLAHFMISQQAWDYIQSARIAYRLVFAHPALLAAHPETSLYYRGLCGMSRKRVQSLAVNIDKWEERTARRIQPDSFLKVARLYNAIISSIIVESTAWTLDDGYRTIVATLGMTLDGSMRNLIGRMAEREIKDLIRTWLKAQGLMRAEREEAGLFELQGRTSECQMLFGTEPDIKFQRAGQCVATIEIKGGTDPAGALERLGAVQKSFNRMPPHAKNFLVVGVVTPEMRNRLERMPNLERYFLLSDLRASERAQAQFMEEIFNHALRLTGFVAP